MKKMSFQLAGMGISKILGALALLMGLMIFSQDAQAQSGAADLSADVKTMTFKTSNSTPVSFDNLVDAGTAVQRLKTEYDGYLTSQPSTAKEEVIRTVAMEYIAAVASSLMQGTANVEDALVTNLGVVDQANARFKAAYQVKSGDVLQAATDALRN